MRFSDRRLDDAIAKKILTLGCRVQSRRRRNGVHQ